MNSPRRIGSARALAILLAAAAAAGTSPARAALPTLGSHDHVAIKIEGVSSDIEANVRSYLTLSRYVERSDLSDTQVRRLADRAVDEAADALRPYGYYSPSIRSRTTYDAPNWIVRIKINPGDPVLMKTVAVQLSGAGRDDREFRRIIATSPLKPGARLSHPGYEALKTDLMRSAQERGFLDAKFTRRELLVDPTAPSAEAYLDFDTGSRYVFGDILIQQDVLEARKIHRYLRIARGQPYSVQQMHATQYALEDSNYFASVAVTPGERDPATLSVPIVIRGEPIRRDRYAVSAGYGTDTGLRGKLSWDRRRVNDLGHRLHAEVTASQIKQEAITTYVIPIGDPSLEKLEFSTDVVNEKIGDLRSKRVELSGGVTQVMGHWQRVLFLKVDDEQTINPAAPDTHDWLLIPGISFASLPPNFLTGWTRDAAYYFELTGSPSSLGSDASYLRFYTRGERVWPVAGPWYLRLRGELGTSWVDRFSQLPASQRFFAGGDRSVRGFALNELGPTEVAPDGTKTTVGGRNKIVGSIELERDFPHNLRGAMFFDAGNAFDSWNTPLEYSAGLGVRLKLPMVMIGFDIAQALSESGRRPRFHLNITQVL
ncbi:MAG TPA: BamA/TamA family outer membrane protein [Steroidobacteraceae bacterium]|nr:BamA/TamA family outer membrane protein [Steroidobacteraceae bacterium]